MDFNCLHCVACPGKASAKIYRGDLNFFEKVLRMENCPKNYNRSGRKKKTILRIAIENFDKALSVPRNTLDVHFGIISKSFHQNSACLAVHLSLWYKKHGLKHFFDLFEIKHTEFFSLYIWFAVQQVSATGNSFFASNLIRIKFTFYWFCGSPFIVATEISISLKIISHHSSV